MTSALDCIFDVLSRAGAFQTLTNGSQSFMRLYNTQSQSLEEFTSPNGKVGIYVCGVTPYDTTHVGHAFTFLTFDILTRYLRFQGYDVTYVQNVTDIDDDILRKSKEMGLDWRELGGRETDQFLSDMRNLNAVDFDHYVAATEHITEIVENVAVLIDKGLAYVVNGSVYFSIAKDPDFGKLSHLNAGEMLPIANERGNNPDDPNKQDPLDFVLWQAAQPGEPSWSSPWGDGRPGWHIECSVMSMKYLGRQIDIHGGGYDLIFPHHECEIAQSESVTGVEPFVRYWMHAAMVDYQGEKMSKSLGNMVYVRNILETHTADAFRLYLAHHHYRQRWKYIDDELDQWATVASELQRAAARESGTAETQLDASPFRERFLDAMDNDLDTRAAVGALRELASAIVRNENDCSVGESQVTLRQLGDLLGLTLRNN